MNTCVVGGHKVELYAGIDEMPMANYHKFNKYLMFESGLAPDASGVIGHLSRMNELILAGEYDKLRLELQNTYQAISYIMEEMSPTAMAFACIVHSIDGRVVTDLSDESLKAISYSMNRESFKVLKEKVLELKKKLTLSLKPTSKRRFTMPRRKERQST